jgi:class 3 adenylate cyclase
VKVCPSCGTDNRPGARFCDSCAAPLAEQAPPRELLKTVTVLFCDVTGSTELGEQLLPESLRRVMARYFEVAKEVVERHGGTVEKFIGDAVMAVFGIPAAHEDDALRAARAAVELRAALVPLNAELAEAYGTHLELRTGLNTGEVVTGTEERLATGDAVNVAARLEQKASPGEILIGERTLRLVRDYVEVETVAPLALKGKAEPVAAHRLVDVAGGTAGRRTPTVAMVGRERQRKLLDNAFANVARERLCHLFTVLGTAGVGKSRLAAEFLAGVDGTIVHGRCLSYGEGISYWPATEVVKELLGEADDRPAELGLDQATGQALAPILGDETVASSPEEIAWAVRKLFEGVAAERPLVVVFDDLHWGEPVFLDLVEDVADVSRDAPILLLCIARPELLDRRPTWGGGKLNATNVLLEPLAPAETDELIDRLLSGDRLDASLRERIREAAGGNPLFVGEMLAMLAESGHGDASPDVVVPPTIQALLASRLDQLHTAERGVLERGAVEGHVFHRGAVVALAPDEPHVDGRLVTLVRKDLVRPERSLLAGDDAYRFRHLLIRDAAYESLPKATRAELHERFADWVERHAPELVELDEIVGYHLERAYAYRTELGPLDDAARALGPRAADRLRSAAKRALARGDIRAAHGLAPRALGLATPGTAGHRWALLELARVLFNDSDVKATVVAVEELSAAAELAGDNRVRSRALLLGLELVVARDPASRLDSALAQAEAVTWELERLGDDEGVAWGLRLVANFLGWLGQTTESARVLDRALRHAKLAKSSSEVAEILMWQSWELWWGPVPAADGVRRVNDIIAQAVGLPRLEGAARTMRGCLKVLQGQLADGRADMVTGRALLAEVGHLNNWAGTAMVQADAELAAGQPAMAEAILREAYEFLRATSETGYLATIIGYLSVAALDQGKEDEALAFADETEKVAQPDDFEPHCPPGMRAGSCPGPPRRPRRGNGHPHGSLRQDRANRLHHATGICRHLPRRGGACGGPAGRRKGSARGGASTLRVQG